jgi:chromosomal replication initiator protein
MDTRAPVASAALPADAPYRHAPALDAFVAGPGNLLAYRAMRHLAESDGRELETLLLVGPAGSGKTHLLRALHGTLLAARRPAAPLYVPADRFHRQFVFAVQRHLLDPFRRKYRTADLLLVDDVQTLSTKPRTQEEFLHTFDALLHAGRRIVMASDRPPYEIEGLGRALQNRIRSAVALRLDPPDAATRLAFLQSRTRAAGLDIPEEDLAALAGAASTFGDLVRCLEALRMGRGDVNAARRALGGTAGVVTPESIARQVGATLGVPVDELRGIRRTRGLVEGRRLCFHLGRRLTPLTLAALGRVFGGRDHATVLQAARHVEIRRKSDAAYDRRVAQIEETLRREGETPGVTGGAPAMRDGS